MLKNENKRDLSLRVLSGIIFGKRKDDSSKIPLMFSRIREKKVALLAFNLDPNSYRFGDKILATRFDRSSVKKRVAFHLEGQRTQRILLSSIVINRRICKKYIRRVCSSFMYIHICIYIYVLYICIMSARATRNFKVVFSLPPISPACHFAPSKKMRRERDPRAISIELRFQSRSRH